MSQFYCCWDDSYGDPTIEAAFEPPLRRVRGWTGGTGDATVGGGEGGGGAAGLAGGCGGAPGAPAAAVPAAGGEPAGQGGASADAKGGFLYTDN